MEIKIDRKTPAAPGSYFPINDSSKKSHQTILDTRIAEQGPGEKFKDLFNRLPDNLFSGVDFSDENQEETAGPILSGLACKPALRPDPSGRYEPPVSTAALNPDMAGADTLSKTMDYMARSVNQLIKGNYTDNVTLLGTCAQIGTGLLGLDLPADIRDLTYDLTHWEWSWGHAGQTLLDAAGLLPLVGAIKYGDEAAALVKNGVKSVDGSAGLANKAIDGIGEVWAAKGGIATPGTNLRAIAAGVDDLNPNQAAVLSRLEGFGSKTVVPKAGFGQTDLAALSAATGDEFAMFTTGGRRLIVRGNAEGIPIGIADGSAQRLASQGWRWSSHVHPDGILRSSVGDRNVLDVFRNQRSAILDPVGGRSLFSPAGDMISSNWLP